MPASFGALLFRPTDVSDRALSQGFAVALAGFDVSAPRLALAPLRGAADWWVAFYEGGNKLPRGAEHEAFEHLVELFEDELSPPVAVLDAAAAEGHPHPTVYAVIVSDDPIHDDVWKFTPSGFERHFVRQGDEGDLEAGVETSDARDAQAPGRGTTPLALPDEPAGENDAALNRVIGRYRGTTFLAAELNMPALAALMRALYVAERQVEVRLVPRGPAAIEAEVRHLNRALGRCDGRGAFTPPRTLWSVPLADTYNRFARTYDFADPTDPADLYRELSIGAITGTLHFLRDRDLQGLGAAPQPGAPGYPIAELRGSALGSAACATLVLSADGDSLRVVRSGSAVEAGPTFGELVRYLALGWTKRTEAEEDMIGALMLRARLRVPAAGSSGPSDGGRSAGQG